MTIIKRFVQLCIGVVLLINVVNSLPLGEHNKFKRSIQDEGIPGKYIIVTKISNDSESGLRGTGEGNTVLDFLINTAEENSTDSNQSQVINYEYVGIGYAVEMNEAALKIVSS